MVLLQHNIDFNLHKDLFVITDLPGILSGNRLGMIDPHEDLFINGRARTSTFDWHLQSELEAMEKISDQWTPYLHKVCYMF